MELETHLYLQTVTLINKRILLQWGPKMKNLLTIHQRDSLDVNIEVLNYALMIIGAQHFYEIAAAN